MTSTKEENEDQESFVGKETVEGGDVDMNRNKDSVEFPEEAKETRAEDGVKQGDEDVDAHVRKDDDAAAAETSKAHVAPEMEDDDDDPGNEAPKMQLRIEIRHDDDDDDEADYEDQAKTDTPEVVTEQPARRKRRRDNADLEEESRLLALGAREVETDPKILSDLQFIKDTPPSTRLEVVLSEALQRKESHISRLSNEINKLKAFISKRKQTYKRKRKDESAPTRALSAYNIFVQDRFAKLAKENEAALKSADSDAQLKRVPPSNLVSSTGNEWKLLPPEEKVKYEERAKTDRKRYEDQMAKYQPPDKQANRKRNKTGYNMFFSAHVLRLKQNEGVPSERGSVARMVGIAWKQLSAEEKQYYENQADKHNGMNPVEKDGEEDEDDILARQPNPEPYPEYGGMPPPMHPGMHQPPQHDPRHHGYAAYPPHHMYAQPPHGYYDYGHHSQSRHSRSQGYQGYPPAQGHPY